MPSAPAVTLLDVDPQEILEFPLPSETEGFKQYMKLRNVSGGNVAYKLKMTAVESYHVRNGAGVLPPSKETSIQITLNPLKPKQDFDGSNHCFLLQAMAVEDDVREAPEREKWAERGKAGDVQELRLAVSFEEGDFTDEEDYDEEEDEGYDDRSRRKPRPGYEHVPSGTMKKLWSQIEALQKEVKGLRGELKEYRALEEREEIWPSGWNKIRDPKDAHEGEDAEEDEESAGREDVKRIGLTLPGLPVGPRESAIGADSIGAASGAFGVTASLEPSIEASMNKDMYKSMQTGESVKKIREMAKMAELAEEDEEGTETREAAEKDAPSTG